MSISPLTYIGIVIVLLVSLALPVISFLYVKKKYKVATVKPLIIGALVWLVVTQVLEQALHLFVITQTPLLGYPIGFAIYAALAAGIFEEGGRFFAFTYLLKKFRVFKDGVLYGIGHGGMEAVLIGGIVAVQSLVFISLLSSGSDQLKDIPSQTLEAMKATLQGPWHIFLLAAIERVFAFFMHIVLSLVVLYGIVQKRTSFLFYAIALHALFDFIPALFQVKIITNVFLVEGMVGAFFLVSLFIIAKLKPLFSKSEK